MDDDAYAHVGGSLSLKKSKKKKKKHKHKHKHSKKEDAALKDTVRQEADEHAEKEDDGMTPAERAFAKEQAKREAARIREKAMKTHKEKVQELNKKLDTMTEHHDIPKVSWTK
ncbi:hypothetical protein PTSG_09583 [Salpingoeca rosetta]|uniref:Protein FAM32A n=1 Tax=Salpingoeca rosetta (strain ATCC 50818 / BSB-021) TaxID=946362 RepID=F2ULF1_SALR5|nr:uncharacterized protein PTSG_09583 [Salpingoeca rosetta]EGD77950.1 hypothetical protein PTSG_09583 [Salpingoeca rosetta]|eukprot:XP_004990013.1 hypothetical protein PTSG_09583 [Salpingoeca rosetta]